MDLPVEVVNQNERNAVAIKINGKLLPCVFSKNEDETHEPQGNTWEAISFTHYNLRAGFTRVTHRHSTLKTVE